MSIHFKGVYFLTQSLLPLIADGGRIINLSTGLTRFALPGYSAYAAMKGAIALLGLATVRTPMIRPSASWIGAATCMTVDSGSSALAALERAP